MDPSLLHFRQSPSSLFSIACVLWQGSAWSGGAQPANFTGGLGLLILEISRAHSSRDPSLQARRRTSGIKTFKGDDRILYFLADLYHP